MKKFTASILALSLILAMLAGCSGKGGGAAASPSAPASPSPSAEASPSPSPEVSATPSPSAPPDVSPSPSVSPADPTPAASPDPVTPSPTPDASPPPSPEVTPPDVSPSPAPAIQRKPVTKTATRAGAEATITALYTSLAAGMTWGEVWDKYVYSGSKTLGYTRSSFITEKEDFQKTYGIKYTGISISSSEETKPGVFLVNGLLKYDASGETVTENGADYVVFDGGEYYISLSGSLLEAAFTKCVSSFPNIACLDAVVCEYADKTVVECTLNNISDIEYFIGAATGLPVTVWQDGASVTVDCAPGRIAAGGYYALTVELRDYTGLPSKLTLEKIIRLLNVDTGESEAYPMDILLYY